MTNPSDPGHHSRPPAHGQPEGPYGPPPGSQQPGPHQSRPQEHGPVPGPRPPGPAYGQPEPQRGWTPPPRDPASKSLVGALLDLNFDHMVTPRLVKIIYALALVPISLLSLLMVVYGLAWLAEDATFFGLLLIAAAPFTWIFQVLGIRVLMEFMINQFKISEYLRAIKDKD